MFFDVLVLDLFHYFNTCFGIGELSPSQRLSFIKLICKVPSKAENLKFWRPISLLNVDYKIISKIICNRLLNVMSSLVHLNQTCSVPGRSILDYAHLLRSLLDYVSQKDLPTLFR